MFNATVTWLGMDMYHSPLQFPHFNENNDSKVQY